MVLRLSSEAGNDSRSMICVLVLIFSPIIKFYGYFFNDNGAEVDEVDERNFGPRAVVVFEFEAYPEPKVLTPSDLRALYSRYKSFKRVAEVIGASEAFARQNAAKERD